jgi:hypothetical protein
MSVRIMGPGAMDEFAVMAMLYKGSQVLVTELEPGKENVYGEWGAFDKVVLAFVNLDDGPQSISATAKFITLGVDDGGSAVASLRIIGNTPSSGRASLLFAVPESGTVTLDLYNAQGILVTRLVDGERMEAGEHVGKIVLEV